MIGYYICDLNIHIDRKVEIFNDTNSLSDKVKNKNHLLSICTLFLLFTSSCISSTNNSEDLSDSLEPVEDVIAIEGTDDTVIRVNQGDDTYFNINFSQIGDNDIIENNYEGEGWCIDWKVPIDTDNTAYSGVQLYSTYNVEGWKPLNYFFNIVDELKSADSELSLYEFQIVIWSLRGFPQFDLDAISDEDLPSRMVTDGVPNFSREKVSTILEIVEEGYQDFEYDENSRFAVIAETPADVQTVITVVN